MERIARHPAVARAREIAAETDDETLNDLVEAAEIPAPPFGEEARGRWAARRFREVGLEDVATDEAGNVLARLPGPAASDRPPVLLAAHLDTIFPPGTDVRVRRKGDRWIAPGIADNARGLAAIVAVGRAAVRAGLATRHPLVFAATVGEEGVGDLRGVKHLFREGSPWRSAAAFVSLDGSGCRRVVHRAIASRRLRVALTGPGGHSWADWGRPNPIHSLGLAVAEILEVPLPRRPRTVLTVGRIGGGTSVNAIPEEAWLELDLRSEEAGALHDVERRIRGAVEAAAREGNRRRRRDTAGLRLSIEVIGDRPGGETPADDPLVRAALEATRFIDLEPELVASSTDANIPMALGIPAVALGAGGESGGTHTLEEWYANRGGPEGVVRALLTVAAAAGPA